MQKDGIISPPITLTSYMKRLNDSIGVMALVTLVACAGLKAEEKQPSVNVGDVAPGFVLLNQQGQKVSLKQFQGKKAVVLAFSRAHW